MDVTKNVYFVFNRRMNEMTKLNKLFEIDPLLGRSVLMALGLDASHKLLGKRITRHEILCAVYHQIVYGGDYARNLVVSNCSYLDYD